MSYVERNQSDKWSGEETQQFFMALSIFGTDFTMIEKVFEKNKVKRTRESIKSKFRKQEKLNKAKIDEVLLNKQNYTLKDYEAKYGKLDLDLIPDDEVFQDYNTIFFENSESEEESEEESSDLILASPPKEELSSKDMMNLFPSPRKPALIIN
mmetsp:Transcript_36151/g.35105  ORF Transcript_36151/g.35105 Transcript_36151/m.35105 type:complete len:153 (+) Transcript_36151:476-934(+)